jgi:hypothetical protein
MHAKYRPSSAPFCSFESDETPPAFVVYFHLPKSAKKADELRFSLREAFEDLASADGGNLKVEGDHNYAFYNGSWLSPEFWTKKAHGGYLAIGIEPQHGDLPTPANVERIIGAILAPKPTAQVMMQLESLLAKMPAPLDCAANSG